jgi:hypothetical protein
MPDLVVIEHTQPIAYDDNGTPQERLSVSVRFTYEAFSSGWVKENFRGRGGPTDFLVMTAIANHARPLHGADLRLLVRLGAATKADEGRLYARVTDVGLADELGCGRDTVKNAAERLAEKQLIRICELPDDFRDSRGQFSGTKAFLISGIPSSYVSKAITPGNDSSIHRAGLTSTDGSAQADRAGSSSTGDDTRVHRAGLSSTVKGSRDHRAGLAVTADPAHRAGLAGTNKEEEEKEEEEEEVISSLLDRFASRKNDPAYRPCKREREQVQELLDEGYGADQIAGAIDQAFASRPPHATPVRSFGYVLSYVHRRLRPIGEPSTEVDLTGASPIGDQPTGMAIIGVPSAADASALQISAARTPQAANDPMAPVYTLLEAASVRDIGGVEDAICDVPGIRLGLQHLMEIPERFYPEDIHSAVLAAVSRSVPPERLVGYTQAVLENARREAREQERLKQSLSAIRPASPDEASIVSDEYPASSQDTVDSSVPAGPGKEACRLWQVAQSELALQMTTATYATWVRPAELLAWESQDDDNGGARTRVVLGTPNEYVKDWLENRLFAPIQRTLSGLVGNTVEVEFEVCDQSVDKTHPYGSRSMTRQVRGNRPQRPGGYVRRCRPRDRDLGNTTLDGRTPTP